MTVAACAETTSGAWRDLRLGISPVLVFLLMVLTPIGTGQGVHRDQLMDPVFPHLHFLGNGVVRQAAAPGALPRPAGRPPRGQGLGAGAGAAEAELSLGLTPVVPGDLGLAQ